MTMSPPPVPSRDGTVYLVLDDFGEFGRAWREIAREALARAVALDNELPPHVHEFVERAA
jgi:hypothetical protein